MVMRGILFFLGLLHVPDLEEQSDAEEGQEDRGDDQPLAAELRFVEGVLAGLLDLGQDGIALGQLLLDLGEGQAMDEVLGRDEDGVDVLQLEHGLADLDALLLGDLEDGVVRRDARLEAVEQRPSSPAAA